MTYLKGSKRNRALLILVLATVISMTLVHNIYGAASFPLKGGERILFIGNSLTAKLPATVNQVLTDQKLPNFDGHRLQIWNQTLETHWKFSPDSFPEIVGGGENGYKIKGACSMYKLGQYNTSPYTTKGYILALEAIKNGTPDKKPWDFVILQDYAIGDTNLLIKKNADGTITTNGRFYTYAKKFVDEVRKTGAQPIFYMNWVLNPAMVPGGTSAKYWIDQSSNTVNNYKLVGEALNIPVIPVCEIQNTLCTTMKPADKNAGWLYSDNVHPNALGQSLLNYTFASFFSRRSALSFPYKEVTGGTTELDTTIKKAIDTVLKKYNVTTGVNNFPIAPYSSSPAQQNPVVLSLVKGSSLTQTMSIFTLNGQLIKGAGSQSIRGAGAGIVITR